MPKRMHPGLLPEAIRKDPRVMRARAAIAQVEHEIEAARANLKDLPTWAVEDLLSRGQEKIKRLRQSEAEAVAAAERIFLADYNERIVQSCKAEAEPKLAHVQTALNTARQLLLEIVTLDAEARAHGGAVMQEALDNSSVAVFVPHLEYLPSRGRWRIRR